MFALRQIDREPAVRPAANGNCLVLGEGRSLPFSHFSLPSLSSPFSSPPPFLALYASPPFSSLSTSLVWEWQPLPTQWCTPSFPALQGLQLHCFSDWAWLGARSRYGTIAAVPPAHSRLSSQEKLIAKEAKLNNFFKATKWKKKSTTKRPGAHF